MAYLFTIAAFKVYKLKLWRSEGRAAAPMSRLEANVMTEMRVYCHRIGNDCNGCKRL